ncbi:YfzA family protein [Lysinibacillus sp. KU-BSD001]|uniref:YfzA family protein n=1 Tax=Lysinibacillus sp. KU-BSD001 TaxID=3141328 RepID=UPI0036E79EA8
MLVNKQKNSVPLLKRTWVSLVGTFLLSQFIFITFEATGWIPNLQDINGTLFGRIAESPSFIKWFSFYETAHFNLFTVFFAIILLLPGMIGAIKDVFRQAND